MRESNHTAGSDVMSLLREYDLDTGRGYPVQVNATDLFKESRRQNADSSMKLMICDEADGKDNTKRSNAVVEEAKRTVTKLLTEVHPSGSSITAEKLAYEILVPDIPVHT